MGKREMRDRPVETLEWETSWGRIAVAIIYSKIVF